MPSVNLIPAPWESPIHTQAALREAIKQNKEFQTADIIHGYGSATTPQELRAAGITHAQFRYGRNKEKVFYVKL